MKKLWTLGMVLLLAVTADLRAQTSDTEDRVVLSACARCSWRAPYGTRFLEEEDYLSLSGWIEVTTERKFRVEPATEYELSGLFRAPFGDAGRFECGFVPLDGHGNPIPPRQVMNVSDTYTTLSKSAYRGETTIEILTRGDWRHGCMALGAQPDFSDLPNPDIHDFLGERTRQRGKVSIFTLKAPLTKDYPEGTGVRCHLGNRLWTMNRFQSVGRNWTRFSGRICGLSRAGESSAQWWPGTCFARIFILIHSQTIIDFAEIKVTVGSKR